MKVKWKKDGTVDRSVYEWAERMSRNDIAYEDIADALDECVAALLKYRDGHAGWGLADATLRKLGVEP